MAVTLLLDFDGTITRSDTLATLANLSIARKPAAQQAALQHAWSSLVADYTASHEAHAATYPVPAEERTTLDAERAWLCSLAPLERASFERVGESGVFAGFASPDEVCALGEASGGVVVVAVRRGFREFCDAVARQHGGRVAVVSVNFSAAFIEGVMGAAGVRRKGIDRGICECICANEIVCPDGTLRGPLASEGGHGLLLTSGDKASAAQRVSTLINKGEAVVYVGDSATDLECLVQADKGLVMSDHVGGALLGTLRRLGFEVGHVDNSPATQRLVWARDFGELIDSGLLDKWMAEFQVDSSEHISVPLL